MGELNVLWLGKYVQDWDNLSHEHTFYQLFGLIGGQGSIVIGGQRYVLEKEQLYLIPPGTRHVISKDDPDNIPKFHDIKFEILDSQLADAVRQLGTRVRLKHYEWFSRLFDDLLEESNQKNPFYYPLINATFFSTLVQIIRDAHESGPGDRGATNLFDLSVPETYEGLAIQDVLQYIRDHYARPISLDRLAKLAAVNKTKLITVFKELLGTTPLQYINQLRLQKAKELLINTDINISEVARVAGFRSIHYFSRIFKDKVHCSPKEFRSQNAKNRFYDL